MVNKNRRHDRRYFYKYVTASTAKKILATGSLRWRSPVLFNDPFDVVRIIRVDFSYSELQKAIIELAYAICDDKQEVQRYSGESFRNLCFLAKNIPNEDRLKIKRQLSEGIIGMEFSELESTKEMQAIWDRFIRQSRIFCMTEDYCNDTMWAHYADNHKGAVLELECLDLYDSPLLVAEKVVYSNENISVGTVENWMNIITGKTVFDYKTFFSPLERLKKENWNYEKEWRVISIDLKSVDLFEDVKVHPLTFSRVFLGTSITEDNENDIRKLCLNREKAIPVEKEVINQYSRKIEFVESN
ncbi:MAG: DUF2971 domain-containing protein [Bacteroidetes bacterium]|nr:DUF2971 domain-containing protein [Bacteroidota bacterium]